MPITGTGPLNPHKTMSKTLTNADLYRAARALNCELALIRAVDEVESNGSGFTQAGGLVLRFESAWFKRYTGQTVVGSGREAYLNAERINPRAAKLSTSWGRYQIMGFNHQICGYATVEAMHTAFEQGEGKHLDAFVAFVKAKKIDDDLRTKNWRGFAYTYNGSGYANGPGGGYHTKLQAAYEKYQNEQIPEDTTEVLVKKKSRSGCGSCSGCSSSAGCGCIKADGGKPSK